MDRGVQVCMTALRRPWVTRKFNCILVEVILVNLVYMSSWPYRENAFFYGFDRDLIDKT